MSTPPAMKRGNWISPFLQMTLPSCKAPSKLGLTIFSHDFQRLFFPHVQMISHNIFPIFSYDFPYSMDWIKGNFTGKPHISWENLWFPVSIFPWKPIHWHIFLIYFPYVPMISHVFPYFSHVFPYFPLVSMEPKKKNMAGCGCGRLTPSLGAAPSRGEARMFLVVTTCYNYSLLYSPITYIYILYIYT